MTSIPGARLPNTSIPVSLFPQAVLPAVREYLGACDFFALDCEMTGLFLDGQQEGFLDDMQDRWAGSAPGVWSCRVCTPDAFLRVRTGSCRTGQVSGSQIEGHSSARALGRHARARTHRRGIPPLCMQGRSRQLTAFLASAPTSLPRYTRTAAAAHQYVINQFGLSCFKRQLPDGPGGVRRYTAATFNFYLFPRPAEVRLDDRWPPALCL